MDRIDYIETIINNTIHVTQWYSNTALCGASLTGKIRARKEAHVNCSKCKAAR